MNKFNIDQTVQCKITGNRYTVASIRVYEGRRAPYYIMDCGAIVPEVDLKAPDLEIQTVYRLDGQIFENRQEAEEHLKRIKLFDEFEKLFDVGAMNMNEYRIFSGMLEKMIKDNKAVIEILK